MKNIVDGVSRFQSDVFPSKRGFFRRLARGQEPHVLMISCSDSRVDMSLITQSDPGEIFAIRNAGNIVPPYDSPFDTGSATLDYALAQLPITDIVVCGHSDCGAMHSLLLPGLESRLPSVARWLQFAELPKKHLLERAQRNPAAVLRTLTRANVLRQLFHLQTHPAVAKQVARGQLALHGWVYDIANGTVIAFDADAGQYLPLSSSRCVRPGVPEAQP